MSKLTHSIYIAASLLLGVSLITSCAFAPANARKRKAESAQLPDSKSFGVSQRIDNITLGTCVRMEYTHVPGMKGLEVSMRAENAATSWWDVEVSDHTLKVNTSKQFPSTSRNPELIMTVRGGDLNRVQLNTTGSFKMDRYSSTSPLTLICDAATSFDLGSVILEGKNATFQLTASGAPAIRINSLETPSAKLGLSGGSSLTISRLSGSSATVIGNGAVNANIREIALNTLNVNSSGASDLTIQGQANTATLSASGIGKINATAFNPLERLSISEDSMAEVNVNGSNRTKKDGHVIETRLGSGNYPAHNSQSDEIPIP